MQRFLSRLALAASVAVARPAVASFHLWDVDEVFSNADGSVQYVELFDASPGEQFLTGHFLRTQQNGSALETFTFDKDLLVGPSDSTKNRHFLVATPAFEAAAGIKPDYLLPGPGWIEVGVADVINYANVDSFSLAGLPTDGVHALFDGGATGEPTPTNFAGEVGTLDLPEPAAGLASGAALAALLVSARHRARRSCA